MNVRLKRCVCPRHVGNRVLPITDFGEHSTSRDGYQSYCKKCRNDFHRIRRQKDPRFYLMHHIATRVRQQVGADGYPPGFTENIDDYLGYKLLDLVKELNLDLLNREQITLKEAIAKGYHLDHKFPLSKFDVSSVYDESFRKCWEISNLWMIPAHVNLAKSNQVLSEEKLGEIARNQAETSENKAEQRRKLPEKRQILYIPDEPRKTQEQEHPTMVQRAWDKAFG